MARPGLGSNFFDLGGPSTEAMVLAGQISAAPGIRVSMADLSRRLRLVTWVAGRPRWLMRGDNR